MCNKHVHSNVTQSSRIHCPIGKNGKTATASCSEIHYRMSQGAAILTGRSACGPRRTVRRPCTACWSTSCPVQAHTAGYEPRSDPSTTLHQHIRPTDLRWPLVTAKNRDQLRNPIRSAIEYGLPLPFYRRTQTNTSDELARPPISTTTPPVMLTK